MTRIVHGRLQAVHEGCMFLQILFATTDNMKNTAVKKGRVNGQVL
jgi:hypothetical protein